MPSDSTLHLCLVTLHDSAGTFVMSSLRHRFRMARPGGLELPTFWFVARRSIQLSYGRAVDKYYHRLELGIQQRRKSLFATRCGRSGLIELLETNNGLNQCE